ncbi:tetratricopeptide repeat protein [Imhoffiella purpurea]|uniref:Kinesin light chain n=1 Tax=Imhoffiella purpurea TaxID=1249627 RepID=W9V2L8_9GAMM|nr:tetratricopeptide repeat protein [Imhoffiella purpurea]EXJ13574.1 hypothetical protein D779_3577 [Imhoffiella purpurea]
MQEYFGFAVEVYEGFLNLNATNQVAWSATVAAPLASVLYGVIRLATRKLKHKMTLIKQELEQSDQLSRTRQQRIAQLEKEITERDETIQVLEAMLPSTCLAIAERERKDGNEERAIRVLGQGLEALRADLYACCLELAGYHVSLLPDYGTEALDQAEQLARIANLLQPEANPARELLAEILAIRSEQQHAQGDTIKADTLWIEATDFLSGQAAPIDLADLVMLGDAQKRAGHYRTAEAILNRAQMLAERMLGKMASETLVIRGKHAEAVGLAGRYQDALERFAKLLPLQERVLGAEHSDTLATRNNLAVYTGEAGDTAGARDLLAKLVPLQERVLGAEHSDTLVTRNNLAVYTGEAGDAAGARDLLAKLLLLRERVLGAEHPYTLSTRGNLAVWTGKAGDAAGARDLLAKLLPLRERVLGAEHPDTLSARGNLAAWTGEAGDVAGARDLLAKLLPLRERVLGAEHPDTLSTRGNLAVWTGEAGDAAGARDLLAKLLPLQERVLGAEHPNTLATRGNLAVWTGEAGDAAGARDLLAKLLPLQERVLGAEHSDTLETRNDLTFWSNEAQKSVAPNPKTSVQDDSDADKAPWEIHYSLSIPDSDQGKTDAPV